MVIKTHDLDSSRYHHMRSSLTTEQCILATLIWRWTLKIDQQKLCLHAL